jgi:hypothetical protein
MNQMPQYNEDASMNTPARAVKNTNNMPEMSATGNPAHPSLNSEIPAAANPMMLCKTHPTAAVMDRAVTKSTQPLLFLMFF